MLKTAPAVFAVGNTYQICAPVSKQCLFSVRVRDEEYFDEINGVMRSAGLIHKVSVPMEKLDEAGEYTVCIRPLVKRKPYFSVTKDIKEHTFKFTPVSGDTIRAYHIADAHDRIEEPINAARTFGNIDLLILNGDIIRHSDNPSRFINIYKICSRLTGGEIPVIFSRGNHDMRGVYAEKLTEYTPDDRGNSYYTFRLGSIWGVVLDCGEDKPDDHPEYGYTVSCHSFRERQTAFLTDIIRRGEHLQPGISKRLVVVHNPFTQSPEPPFDIEQELYTQWARLLKEEIRPHLMLCGHTHEVLVEMPGGESDHKGQPCPVVIGSYPDKGYFAGCGLSFSPEGIIVAFTDNKGALLNERFIPVNE